MRWIPSLAPPSAISRYLLKPTFWMVQAPESSLRTNLHYGDIEVREQIELESQSVAPSGCLPRAGPNR